MGFSEILLTALGAALLMGLVVGLLLWALLRPRGASTTQHDTPTTAQIELLTTSNNELERKLAVEGFRTSRLSEVEGTLMEESRRAESLREDKSAAEAALAAVRQEAMGVREVEVDLRRRLESAASELGKAGTEILSLRTAKAAVDETLSGTSASLAAATESIKDLKLRLGAEDLHALELSRSLDLLRNEKAAADESLSARSEGLKNSEERVEAFRRQLSGMAEELAAAQSVAVNLKTENATIRETLEQERRQTEDKLVLLTGARVEMSNQFKTLAEEVMSRHGESFTKLNREQMDGILTPLKEKLGEFERSVQTSHVESVKERATLAEQIRHIAETGAAMGKETKELTEALRGKSQTQGAWGEMVLSTILERSGLRPGEEYAVQKSYADDEGRRLRPDVVINLPGNKNMVVDAKVSLTAFECLVNAGSDEERAHHLQRHLQSVRNHISTLGSKDYHQATGLSLDFVVMFVPIEGALAAALTGDSSLILFAAEQNVALTTPSTLMIALRTVSNVWHVERRNQNAEDIAIRAGRLYDKFVGFLDDMKAVGDSITRSRKHFDGAMGKLSSGSGNVVRQIEQLKSMGGRASKALPTSLLDAADVTLSMTTSVVETEVTVETTTELLITSQTPRSDEDEVIPIIGEP